jgi:hypothetical protein
MEQLADIVNTYDKIFLFDDTVQSLEAEFALHCSRYVQNKKIFVYSVNHIEYPDDISHVIISNETKDEIRQLYNMYEWTDKFNVVSALNIYASMLNYLETGMMSLEDIVKALLK